MKIVRYITKKISLLFIIIIIFIHKFYTSKNYTGKRYAHDELIDLYRYLWLNLLHVILALEISCCLNRFGIYKNFRVSWRPFVSCFACIRFFYQVFRLTWKSFIVFSVYQVYRVNRLSYRIVRESYPIVRVSCSIVYHVKNNVAGTV